ncbi:MAG: hypothetical protein J2P36_25505 [Ktedonobacteraceae bacterium]|nr:hypothetical protein [Ktedonobacteraceae bacterium]
MTCTSNVIGCLRARRVMVSSWISRAGLFGLMHLALKWCPMEAVSIGRTQLSSRDRHLIHETQNLFGNIVRGVISPLLANVALHGLEEALGIRRRKTGGITGPRALVRYADDFCVFCETKEDAQAVIETLTEWLATRGLTLSAEKTRIVHLEEGFDFLGFTIKQHPSARSKAGYQ